jgi:hypothetical protein
MPRTECYCGESIKAFIVFSAANLFLEIGVKLIVIVHDYVIIFCSLRDEKETNEERHSTKCNSAPCFSFFWNEIFQRICFLITIGCFFAPTQNPFTTDILLTSRKQGIIGCKSVAKKPAPTLYWGSSTLPATRPLRVAYRWKALFMGFPTVCVTPIGPKTGKVPFWLSQSLL